MFRKPTYEELETRIRELEKLTSNLGFRESLDRINQAGQGLGDFSEIIGNQLDAVLDIFNCDRAYFFYPCDPDAPELEISMERTVPQFPGAIIAGGKFPKSPQTEKHIRDLLASDGPVAFTVENGFDPDEEPNKTFQIKSILAIALHPRIGLPFAFGIHQCAYSRLWSHEETRLFLEISRRLADHLTIMISYRTLQRNERLLDEIIENIPNMIFLKDAKALRFTRVNRAGEALLGYSRKELIGKNDYAFFSKEEADFFTAKDREVFRNKQLLDIPEETVGNREGEELILHTKKIPILDDAGNPKYLLGISEDITKRKKAEQELYNAKDRLESFMNSAVDIMMVWDKELNLSAVNDITLTYFPDNTKKEDLVGKNLSEMKALFGREDISKIFLEVMRTGAPFSYQELVDFNENTRWFNTRIFKVGKGVGVIINDNTDNRILEEQLTQIQKFESIGRLAGGVAHDFNNMLGVIIGHTDFALELVAPEHELHTYLQQIMTAAEKSSELTRQLLAFARKQTVAPKILNLNNTLAGMLKILRTLIGEHIKLIWNPDPELCHIKIDPSQVDQLLANLCVNARDAISDTGRITIETKNVVIDDLYCKYHPECTPGDFAMLSVSDNGRGMDKETLQMVFEPFFTTKKKRKGTGLGLATVYGVVKQNKGFINVYSEPGVGTSFKLFFPRQETDAQERSSVPPQMTITHGNETILLVEDEPAILKMTTQMLERIGYHVLAVSIPELAIRIAEEEKEKIHLLISDVIMPTMNGRVLAEQITAEHPKIKSLFMSGYTDDIIAHHGILDRGVNFIQKPFSTRTLAEKVRKILDRP